MAHQKHAKIKRPALGHYHRCEFAILGAPCSRIQPLAEQLIGQLSDQFRTAYMDADHHADEPAASIIRQGARFNYTNKIDYHRWEQSAAPTDFELKLALRKADLLLINGNHFRGDSQVLILDERKYDSLQRKIDRLTNVCLILTTPEVAELPEFLQQALPDHGSIPRLAIDDLTGVTQFLLQLAKQKRPVLKGLVLAGGYSKRMGTDKGLLSYHNGQEQRSYLYQLLSDAGLETHLSCRPDQAEELQEQFAVLPDRFLELGPFGGILTAFQADPDAAWLVVACDLPFVNAQTLDCLVGERDPSFHATSFHNPNSGFPEPLITIWEPRSYPDLLHFLSLGYSCPRKVLINTDVKEVAAPNPDWIRNVNTPEEYEAAISALQKI
jgi:molybdopterin-guanine dinucleotide biosynthesis protein A